MKHVACVRVKTNKKDTVILVRLLVAKLVPTVWDPPKHVQELRQLGSQRRKLVEMHARGKRFQEKDMGWREWLEGMERFQLDLDLEIEKYLKGQIDKITRCI